MLDSTGGGLRKVQIDSLTVNFLESDQQRKVRSRCWFFRGVGEPYVPERNNFALRPRNADNDFAGTSGCEDHRETMRGQ